MAELGLATAIITVVGAAYQSTTKLYHLIENFRTASQTLCDLRVDLADAQRLLGRFEDALKKNGGENLPDGVKGCLRDFEPSMEAYRKVCDDFGRKVAQISSHSTDDRAHWADRVRLQFEEKGILAFKHRLRSHKMTMIIALGLINTVSTDENRQFIEDLRDNITSAISGIAGQIEGLEISLQSLPGTIIAAKSDALADDLRTHELALRQCLKICTAAVDAAPVVASTTIRSMEVINEARQYVAVTEGKPGLVDRMIARDKASQMFLETKDVSASKLAEHFFRA